MIHRGYSLKAGPKIYLPNLNEARHVWKLRRALNKDRCRSWTKSTRESGKFAKKQHLNGNKNWCFFSSTFFWTFSSQSIWRRLFWERIPIEKLEGCKISLVVQLEVLLKGPANFNLHSQHVLFVWQWRWCGWCHPMCHIITKIWGYYTTCIKNTWFLGGGNSNMFYSHPYLGKMDILTNILETTN